MFKIFDEEMKTEHPHFCIKEYKRMLDSLDYKTNKYLEGELTAEEWAAVKTQRKALRAEINSLEARITILNTK